MGRELQKKKNRSSIPKVKLKPKSKRVNPLGNSIIAKNWCVPIAQEILAQPVILLLIRNSSQTLTQNYRRLGLTSRLNSLTGGTEVSSSKSSTTSKLAISSANQTALSLPSARVERDPETGRIIRVIHEKRRKANPLNDPLVSDSEAEDDDMHNVETREQSAKGTKEGERIVRELEAQASMVPERKVRKQSQREREWIARLVERYGTDTRGMARDRRLNPMQQTEADIARRMRKWRDEGGVAKG